MVVAAVQDPLDGLAGRLDMLLEQNHRLVLAAGAAQLQQLGVLALGLVDAIAGEQQLEAHIAVTAQIDLGDRLQCLGAAGGLIEVA